MKQLIIGLFFLAAMNNQGCLFPGNRDVALLPKKHSVKTQHFQVLSDVKLGDEHPLLTDLMELRSEISQTLKLPQSDRKVVLYVFKDLEHYKKYLAIHFPGLAFRRAYFIGTPKELAVYTFWGEKIREDLRHEYTHGVLHAAYGHIPLWLDEGLAEYFEVADATSEKRHEDSIQSLGMAIQNGWTPNLARLESLERVAEMHRIDYQESWAWVHLMLHHSDASRDVLIEYLQNIQGSVPTTPLSQQIPVMLGDMNRSLNDHVVTLSEPSEIILTNGVE